MGETFRRMSLTEDEAVSCVGKGWESLIRRLYASKPEDVEVHQVKEKFGGLRFYVGGAPEEYHRLIDQVCNESYSICEWCGEPGTADDRYYWLLTLCDDCKAKRNKKDTL